MTGRKTVYISHVAVSAADPDISNVRLLIDPQGADNGTTFTDLSVAAHTVSANGTITDTAQFKFGASSAFFTTNAVLMTNNLLVGHFTHGTAFTTEGWYRFNSTAGDQVLFSHNATPGASGAFLRYTGGSLDWFNWSTGNHFSNSWSPSASVWYHIAVCRDGSTMRMFIDGTALATTNAASQAFTNDIMLIGAQGIGGSRQFEGWCGGFRWTKDVGRYASNFTPPTAPFPVS